MIKTSDEEEDYLEMNEGVKNAKEPRDTISLVKNTKIFSTEQAEKS